MKPTKSSKCLAAAALILSLAPSAYSQPEIPSSLLQQASYLKNISKKDEAAMKMQAIHYLSSILSTNPLDIAKTKQVDPLAVVDLSQLDTTPEEMKALVLWANMVDKGTLKANIVKLINELKVSQSPLAATIQALPQSQLDYAIGSLTASIEGIVKMRGLTKDSHSSQYREWSALSFIMTKKIDTSVAKQADTLDLADSHWIRTESAEILINGPASFAKRDQFMAQATKSINILTWSIYDDVTGTQAADLLIKKKQENPNLKIRIIVDGQVAATAGHGDQVARLEKAGIEVIRWISHDLTYVGQHRKMLIVDDEHLIAGGLNFGDVYSHKNPDLSVPRWRDTDVYLKGQAAQEGNRLFAKIWNDQLLEQKQLTYDKFTAAATDSTSNQSGIEVSIINHNPLQSQYGSTIMLTILKAIREAKQQVDIENAYIILFPALKQEISDAIKRGVLVRVFTNSSESVDEPVVSIPILRSVAEFIKMGAKVYVKKGATLHSKLVVVDSDLTLIMSYNLHPRSERVEGEMAIAVRDNAFTQNMHQVFDNDVTSDKATELKSLSDLKMPTSPVSVPTLRLFFDML